MNRNAFFTRPRPSKTSPRPSLRRFLEPLAIGLICLGLLMIFQPLVKVLYTYSFGVIGIGTLLFIIATHLPE